MKKAGKYSEADVLEVLAAVDDQILRDLFPEATPAAIRKVLKEIGKKISPQGAQLKLPVAAKKATPATLSAGGYILHTDGASRGNPGQSGAGVAIFDHGGREVFADGAYLGSGTNNEAEYKALILGLKQAGRLGIKNIAIKMDSELIVRQIQGRYQVKNTNLKALYQQVRGLLNNFSRYTVGHVARKENARADELANRAIDEKLPGW